MPNGGSDCCGTCWFNSINDGEPGYPKDKTDAPHRCTIRDFEATNPFWTYCANHPHHNPARIEVPIGPVYTAGEYPYSRSVLHESIDTEEVRLALLDLLAKIEETPVAEYPTPTKFDEEIIKQLMAFREPRAAAELRRIAAFDPESAPEGENPFQRNRIVTVALAIEALAAIEKEDALDILTPAIERGLTPETTTNYDSKSDPLAPIRYHAVLGLQHCESKAARDLLQQATTDPPPKCRPLPVKCLTSSRNPDV